MEVWEAIASSPGKALSFSLQLYDEAAGDGGVSAKLPVILVAFAMAVHSLAQAQGNIPAAVIEECNGIGNASTLPDCLKGGAVAYEMLEAARSEEFYGQAAEPVIEACAAGNETIETTWICFENAAESAAETRQLIGLDNIADKCTAAISDPAMHGEIEELYHSTRRARFPNEMFFGGGMFYPFQGCPASEEESSGYSGGPEATDRPQFDESACSAYGEIEEVIASNTAEALRKMKDQAKALDDPEPQEFAHVFGLSNDAASYIFSGDEKRGMATAALVGAFLRTHHLELLREAFEDQETVSGSPAAEMGREMAEAILLSIIDKAGENYKISCIS